MAITDPIGDLLTRIRNGQLRGMAKIKSPNSRLRARLLDVLQAEGFIRGYAEVEFKTGRTRARDRAEISRRPARHSRTQARVDAGPPRLCLGEGTEAASSGSWRVDRLHAAGRDDGHRCPRKECGRRSPLPGVLRRRPCLVSAKSRFRCRKGVTASVEGKTVKVKGPKGELQRHAGRGSRRQHRTSTASP